MLKLSFMIYLMLFCILNTVESAELPQIPAEWQIKQATSKDDCINVSGDYQIWGEAGPQSKPTFRGFKGVPYSLDIMLGVDIPDENRKKITRVSINHLAESGITLTFFDGSDVQIQKKISPTERIVTCKQDRLIFIRKSVETKGEATRGLADLTVVLFLAQDGSLIVYTSIEDVSKYLLFNTRRPKEEYWAKFKLVEKN